MRLLINKRDLQNLILWGTDAEYKAKSVGIPFESDELKTIKKLKELRYTKREWVLSPEEKE